jgi:hypothetical protein
MSLPVHLTLAERIERVAHAIPKNPRDEYALAEYRKGTSLMKIAKELGICKSGVERIIHHCVVRGGKERWRKGQAA